MQDKVIFKVESFECADLSQTWFSHLKEYPTYFVRPIQFYLLLIEMTNTLTRICHFSAQIRSIIAHLPKVKLFLRKTNNMAFMYLLLPFVVQNFKIILRADLQLQESVIFRSNSPQNGSLAQNQIFSR